MTENECPASARVGGGKESDEDYYDAGGGPVDADFIDVVQILCAEDVDESADQHYA